MTSTPGPACSTALAPSRCAVSNATSASSAASPATSTVMPHSTLLLPTDDMPASLRLAWLGCVLHPGHGGRVVVVVVVCTRHPLATLGR